MTKGKISKAALDNLNYDLQSNNLDIKMENVSDSKYLVNPTAMLVFANGDLNAAAYHLIQSMKKPFSAKAIASVFVEEAVLERFISIVRPQLPKYDDTITRTSGYRQAMESISRLNAKIIEKTENGSSGAVMVCDFTHEHLGSDNCGVVTLHAFRTAKEAITLFGKESLKYSDVTIWNENHSCAYELVAMLPSIHFYINCYNLALAALVIANTSGDRVTMDKSYHYEKLSTGGDEPKYVVFPIGTIFAN